MFGITPFQSKENALFDTKRALQKGHICSFPENGSGPDPEDPLVAFLNLSSLLALENSVVEFACPWL